MARRRGGRKTVNIVTGRGHIRKRGGRKRGRRKR